ncbi:uncharacterized protein LOC110112000 [Dendrobium catenatum]|uniref:Uncharacterized protein n=1 Tax=Dendrobium catenatum TaxID=906689 RepID=A0A2I0VKG1_9ASPA|nr:uncharacterized protein LOC110112000 [Dendrobium catenatum]PKU63891.1 hypothetical protein MA16_Dca009875 [Dendrobium catenatum]
MADQAFQLRSISLPSRSHPAAAQIEEDLRKLRACLDLSTTETVSDGLRRLGDVYDVIDKLLSLPCNQQHLGHSNQRKWVEEELDLSLRLLDLSGAIRDGLTSTKEHLQEIQFSLRRKSCSDVKSQKTHHYDSTRIRFIKKAIANSLRSLKKQMESSNKRAPCSAVGAILAETREILISLLQLASSFLATPTTNQKASRWAFVCELLHTKVDCEKNEIGTREEFVDALCENIFDLESGLEYFFRKLIQNRVSLLNILSF